MYLYDFEVALARKELALKIAHQSAFCTVAVVMAMIISRTHLGVAPSNSIPRLTKKIEYGDYGSKYHRFGDLDGDGLPDVLLTQVTAPEGEHKAVVTCLTALTLEGKILWQVGKPDPKNIYFPSDFPVQIYDLDRCGHNEVIYIPDENNILTILDGKTGTKQREVKLAGGHDSLMFIDFAGSGYAQDLIVKDRYKSFWVYDKNFRLLWSKIDVNPGHYPMNYDLDNDGKDELLMGYTLYAHDGRELWKHEDFPLHDDAVYIEDMNDDGKAEIAIATSKNAVLLDTSGKILFERPMDHCQHALIGKFRPDLPGKQVFFVSRMDEQPGAKFRLAEMVLMDITGKELWANKGSNIWYTGAARVDRWTSESQNDVALYSRGFASACLIDGFGREVASFPFPPALQNRGGGPEGKDLYEDYYIQPLDLFGDEREEIAVFNHRALYIYTNVALWQKARLYNNTYYPGRL